MAGTGGPDWATIAALGAAVATFAAATVATWNVRVTRFGVGVATLLGLERDFNSDRMRAMRRNAAKSLAAHTQRPEEMGEVDEVLDFFETVALLVRHRALDETMVWDTFFYWIDGYERAAWDHVRKQREKNEAVWRGFVGLWERLCEIERKERPRERPSVEVFLADRCRRRRSKGSVAAAAVRGEFGGVCSSDARAIGLLRSRSRHATIAAL